VKVTVSELCSGHGRCYVLHGELFEADDLGYNLHRGGEFEVPPGLEDAAVQGARDCPERAITVQDD
jgi:ferredoxin